MKLSVRDGDRVKIGDPLLQMDSDREDKDTEQVNALEAIRKIRADQFKGPELALLQTIAKTAVEIATEKTNTDTTDADRADKLVKLGSLDPFVATVARAKARESQLALDRATAQQSQLQFAISRHSQVDVIAKQMDDNRLALLAKQKNQLSIMSPVAGTVHLHVGTGSFAELGSVLLEIG